MDETLGIAGAGTIACGLAAAATRDGQVLLWARSDASAERARATVKKACSKLEDVDFENVEVVTKLDDLRNATFLVEAILEHHGRKAEMLADLGELARHAGKGAVLATTTSSLSIAELSKASGHPESFVGLHVFNPVPRMQLIELAFPPEASEDTAGGRSPSARRSARPRSRSPTSPGSSSTASCFHTSSAPYSCKPRRACPQRTSTPA